jgi:RNA polymerase sigma factor (TIGR02999 family)
MNEVTRILSAIDEGHPRAAEQLLPLVYAELRELAAQRLAQEKPGQTLQATALVHEAYLRLVSEPREIHGDEPRVSPEFANRGHFFAAAAEAMRRILVESARRKKRIKHGGGRHRIDINDVAPVAAEPPDELLDLDEALSKFEEADAVAANLVKLRYFAGLTLPQAAEALGLSLRTAERNWTFARTWLRRELAKADSSDASSP